MKIVVGPGGLLGAELRPFPSDRRPHNHVAAVSRHIAARERDGRAKEHNAFPALYPAPSTTNATSPVAMPTQFYRTTMFSPRGADACPIFLPPPSSVLVVIMATPLTS